MTVTVLTIREVYKAVDSALGFSGFYDKAQVDGTRYQTIEPALEKASRDLGAKLRYLDERRPDTYGCTVYVDGVAGFVEIQAHSTIDGPSGRRVPSPDFGAAHYGGVERDEAEARRQAGARLRARRKALKLTQEQLGERLGKDRTTIVRWESGEMAMDSPKMLDLALKALEAEPTPDA